jgi:hypothetical protein
MDSLGCIEIVLTFKVKTKDIRSKIEKKKILPSFIKNRRKYWRTKSGTRYKKAKKFRHARTYAKFSSPRARRKNFVLFKQLVHTKKCKTNVLKFVKNKI